MVTKTKKEKMSSEGQLFIPLEAVADVNARYVSRTWFFVIRDRTEAVADILKGLMHPIYRVAYLCFAEERTTDGRPFTIGYLEFQRERGGSVIKAYPGLDISILAQRNKTVLTPKQSVMFVRGNFQMTTRHFKPSNTQFWESGKSS